MRTGRFKDTTWGVPQPERPQPEQPAQQRELALQPDYAFIYAWKGDHMGNLVCRKTARNYNPEMAAAARITIASVEQLVEPGELDPDKVHVPGIYVQRMVKVDRQNYIPTID